MLTKAKKQSEFLKYNSRADVLFKKIKDKTQAFVKSGILNDKEAGAQQKRDFFERGVQEETKNALLSKEEDATKNHEGRNNYIVPEEFIDGLWEGSKNSGYNESVKDVEKSQFETFDNVNENGIIELTLDNITKDILKTKPPYSRVPKDWIKAGGSITIDKYGNWIYTDWYGVSVKYINGYPDYKGAKAVVQEVDIGGFISRGVDRRKADRLAPNGSRQRGNVWHHSQDGHTMQEIDGELHRRFTHKGGFTLRKRKE